MSTIIKHKEFPKFKSWTMDLCGRPLTIEVGKVAELANASAMVKYGDTTVLVAVTVAPRPRDGVDFFPLSVDFEEKLYAVGRIPGSFMRREGRPSLPAVLASRLIDRPMRPLFPSDFRNDVCITCTVMSVDYDCSPEVAAMIGASACVSYSEIPFAGPIGCLEVGYCDGQIVLNPNQEQRKTSRMDVTVAATREKVVMIEAGADEIPDEIMYAGIVKAHEEIKKQIDFIDQIVSEIGKPKMEYEHAQFNQELFDKIVADFMDEAKAAMDTDDKNVREERWNAMIDHWHEKYLVHLQVPEEDRQGLAAGGPPCGRPRQERDPSPGRRGGRAAPGPRLRPVHPRPDPGPVRVHPEHPGRLSEAGYHLGGDREAVYAPLQLPALLRGRGQGSPVHQPPGVRPRRPGRAGPGAGAPLGGRVPLRHPRGL